MSTIILVSDFNPMGSGYKSITVGVGTELTRRGHTVKVLAANDRGHEHHYPFSVIPIEGTSSIQEIYGLLKNMKELDYSDVLILADMPVAFEILEQCAETGATFSGLFPLEAPPLASHWAIKLMSLKSRFIISRFGTNALEQAYVHANFVAIPPDKLWVPPTLEERSEAKTSLGLKNFTFLTVAENQERKNLSTTAKIIRGVPDAFWILVTRTKASKGWNITDMLERYGITERTLVIEKGMPLKTLVQLFHAVDGFLITSKAEGLGMPVLEAMASGVLVVAPKHTSFEEHLCDGRGILFENEYQYMDPFGNQERYFASVEDGIRACNELIGLGIESRLIKQKMAMAYANDRSWENVGDVICQSLAL